MREGKLIVNVVVTAPLEQDIDVDEFMQSQDAQQRHEMLAARCRISPPRVVLSLRDRHKGAVALP